MTVEKERGYDMLSWDSELFGYRVVRINSPDLNSVGLSYQLEMMKSDNVKLAYWAVDPGNVGANSAAQNHGGKLVDRKVFFLKSLSQGQTYQNSSLRSVFLDPVNERLYSLALQSGVFSRFFVDPNFLNREFETLYRTWIENSLSGQIANDVLVYMVQDVEAGLITLKVNEEGEGHIGLLAVDSKFRRRSIGKQLVLGSLYRFRELGALSVDVITQMDNVVACNLYRSCGFEIADLKHVYHYWL